MNNDKLSSSIETHSNYQDLQKIAGFLLLLLSRYCSSSLSSPPLASSSEEVEDILAWKKKGREYLWLLSKKGCEVDEDISTQIEQDKYLKGDADNREMVKM